MVVYALERGMAWLICSGDLRAMSRVESGRSDLIQLPLARRKSTGQTRWVDIRWVTWLYGVIFRRSRHKNKRCIPSRYSSTTETAASDSTCFREEFYLPAGQCTCMHIVRVKLWRFCVEKHQTSFLQICGSSKQSQSSWLRDLGCHAASCLPKENPRYRRTETEADWSLVRPWTVDCRHGYWSVAQKT